jgi:glycosyltransferase involved in cell wall biosynthesis
MDVSIITVTWNSAEFIAEQIKSVQKACTTIKYEHIIIEQARLY